MRRAMITTVLALGFGSGVYAQSANVGDPAKGEELFIHCSFCHSNVQGEHKRGPSLYGVIGREMGTAAGYEYSEDLASRTLLWDTGLLSAWLVLPTALVPGTKMEFKGLNNRSDIEHMIAYLSTLK
ncbi:MAG: c-type cytochrome [Pseudomonadota bacterium]